MNGYICTWKNKRIEVYAETIYGAQQKAAAILKPKKEWEISVWLAEKNGVPYEHTAA